MTPCSVDGCENPVNSRQLCKPHYARWWRTGSPDGYRPRIKSPMENIDKDGPGGCWLWTGSLNWKGYGQAWLGGRKSAIAHRWVYEQLVGPIPEGLTLDHLCRVKACVNPEHLEPVTNRVNTRRAMGFSDDDDPDACFRGHRYEPGSYYALQGGKRECKECSSTRHAALYARKKQGA